MSDLRGSIATAVQAVRERFPDVDDAVTVERYPPRRPYYPGTGHTMETGGIFALQFFSHGGRNIATYIPDTQGLQFQGDAGRPWGLARGETLPIDKLDRYVI